MKLTPWILGAALIVPLAGAYAGSKVGTQPLHSNRDLAEILPDRPFQTADAAPRNVERLPNHYAMETPEGRVEVGELAFRGRYSQHYRDVEPADFAYEADLDALEAHYRERSARDYAHASRDPYRSARALDAAQPRIPQRERRAEPARVTVAYADTTAPMARVPHYEAMQQARTGADLQAELPQPVGDVPVTVTAATASATTGPRVIEVAAAFNR